MPRSIIRLKFMRAKFQLKTLVIIIISKWMKEDYYPEIGFDFGFLDVKYLLGKAIYLGYGSTKKILTLK